MCSHLQIPKGLTLDKSGNLFIVGCESSNVHKVSCDGERIGVVLGHKDQLMNPMGIVYDSSEKKVFVTEGSRRVMIFKDKSLNS
jgi:sugar lactone lactonase YvrE